VEAKAVPQAGFQFRSIAARGFPRRPGFGMITSAWAFAKSLGQVAAVIKEVKPDVVITTGGYVSGPVGVWARLLAIPLVLQEQNSVPGAANRWLSLIATEVHINFIESRNYFRRRNNLKVSGNPIRRSLLRQDRQGAYESLGLDPDAKEAVAFAVLANETLFGRAGNLPGATGAAGPRVLGKLVL
jgi:UDP-N-acetylglucosamine--N-acetylmuramyl-(pentapeptide) pyrophosphoryl-undecaprenol N-acetylglucosamine transferase